MVVFHVSTFILQLHFAGGFDYAAKIATVDKNVDVMNVISCFIYAFRNKSQI